MHYVQLTFRFQNSHFRLVVGARDTSVAYLADDSDNNHFAAGVAVVQQPNELFVLS